VSAQTLSGTGSLTVAAHLLRRLLPAGTRVFCSDPTWENHHAVVADAGLGALETYRYWDAKARALDLAGLLADLRAMPEGSVVMLHAVAHNPTGVDPTRAQWAQIADVVAKRKLFTWFDLAYQGFASGDPDADAWAVRDFAARGLEMLVCQSFAKNMGLYCERVGALHVLAADARSAAAVLTHVEVIARPMYSNPPAHGARVVAAVLGTPALDAEWRAELAGAMARVARMRAALRAALEARGTPGDWSHITAQAGMFSFTGLTPAQADRMVDDFHVYMLRSGRINVAGLSEATIDIAADAMHAVVCDLPTPAAPTA
jgi:aspartate aminotransferase